ncbi:MAG: hypothetical protein Mars2KO_10480 [Maribacter sp.]
MTRIVIGNESAEHTITFVRNPLCSPCAEKHMKIENILHNNKNFKCEIIFISNLDNDNPGAQFMRKLFSISKEKRGEALHRWFTLDDKNFESWNIKYKDYDEKPNVFEIQIDHNAWADTAKKKSSYHFY